MGDTAPVCTNRCAPRLQRPFFATHPSRYHGLSLWDFISFFHSAIIMIADVIFEQYRPMCATASFPRTFPLVILSIAKLRTLAT